MKYTKRKDNKEKIREIKQKNDNKEYNKKK